jgi:hypothetical protein
MPAVVGNFEVHDGQILFIDIVCATKMPPLRARDTSCDDLEKSVSNPPRCGSEERTVLARSAISGANEVFMV